MVVNCFTIILLLVVQFYLMVKLFWIGAGSCILNMVDKDFPIELVGWKGFSTLKAYENGECRLHYLRLLGVDVSEFGNTYYLINYLNILSDWYEI